MSVERVAVIAAAAGALGSVGSAIWGLVLVRRSAPEEHHARHVVLSVDGEDVELSGRTDKEIQDAIRGALSAAGDAAVEGDPEEVEADDSQGV